MARRQQLIDRRDALGLSQEDVAQAAGLTANSIRRYELGLSTPRGGDRRAYARSLGWSPERLAIALADEPVLVNGHAVPGWLDLLASLEQASGRLYAYEAVGVHGLLQTPDYAAAVERVGPDHATSDEIDRRVAARMARQAVLTRQPDPLDPYVILDESVLHRVAGDPGVMADQLEHLAGMIDGGLDLRILPNEAGMFPFGSVTLLTQLGVVEPWVAITEDLSGPHIFERDRQPEAFGRHERLWDYLCTLALTPSATADMLVAAAKEYRQ